MASTDDILDAWHKFENELKTLYPDEKDSVARINRLRDKWSKADIDTAHRLRMQRNDFVHKRTRVKDPKRFVSESHRLAVLVRGKAPSGYWLWWIVGGLLALLSLAVLVTAFGP